MPAASASDSVPPLRGGYVGGYKQMNIKESEFEWLRGYLQREESTQKHSMGEASDSSETGSTTDMTDISFDLTCLMSVPGQAYYEAGASLGLTVDLTTHPDVPDDYEQKLNQGNFVERLRGEGQELRRYFEGSLAGANGGEL